MNNYSNETTDFNTNTNFNTNNNFNQPAYTQQYTSNNDNTYPNEKLINMANDIDSLSFNGTNLNNSSNDNNSNKINLYNTNLSDEDNTSLIKSLTKEIINNLKENNIDLSDNLSMSSKSKSSKNKKTDNDIINTILPTIPTSNIKTLIENYTSSSSSPSSLNLVSTFYDKCSNNLRDFFILFILYFVLSQEMIKDFFGKYFTNLNPDSEGKFDVQGVIIYGLILSILFVVIRNLF